MRNRKGGLENSPDEVNNSKQKIQTDRVKSVKLAIYVKLLYNIFIIFVGTAKYNKCIILVFIARILVMNLKD